MDRICVAVLLMCLFYVEKSDGCNNDDICAMIGCDVSFHWTLGKISVETIHATVYHSSSNIAQIIDGDCEIMDNLSADCNILKDEDAWILSLTIFNVTEHNRGDYSLWHFRPDQGNKHTSKSLVVIDVAMLDYDVYDSGKPKVMAKEKPILGRPFEMTCNSSHVIESVVYRWRIHRAQTIYMYNGNTHSIPSLRMTDHLSQVTCQVCLNETARKFSTIICENDACSTDSVPYTIEVIYGPDNISLSLNEINFYLKDREFFTIDCYANCNPNCTFSWKGRKTTESKKLEITSFDSKMAGYYTCHVTNQETNYTSKSNTISLHHVKAVRPEEYWMAPVIISVFLLIFGVALLVTSRCKFKTRAIDSTELCRVSERQTDIEVFRKELERLDRLLHIPSIQDGVSRRTKRLVYPNESQQNNCGPNLQEDPYSTINEDALSADFDHGIDNVINESLHETGRSIEHYDYAYSLEICHVETAHVHASDETCLTPNEDLDRSFEILQDEEIDALETDHAYLALMDDHAHPIEICHVEETETDEIDETYITPIHEL